MLAIQITNTGKILAKPRPSCLAAVPSRACPSCPRLIPHHTNLSYSTEWSDPDFLLIYPFISSSPRYGKVWIEKDPHFQPQSPGSRALNRGFTKARHKERHASHYPNEKSAVLTSPSNIRCYILGVHKLGYWGLRLFWGWYMTWEE